MYNNPFDDFDSSTYRFLQHGGPAGGPGGWPTSPAGGPPQPGSQTPMGPPPNFIPAAPSAQRVQSMGGGWNINRCLFRNTYIWLNNGRSFWFYPIAMTRDQIMGFRWSTRFGWTYRIINRHNILTFTCFFG